MNQHASGKQDFVYHIDEQDRLCEFNAAWSQFALANDGAAVMPDQVLGRTLWDFIEDTSVRELYRQLVHRARAGHPARFDYRCDAPMWRRRFRMSIRKMANGTVKFSSRLQWEEERPQVDMLVAGAPRGEHWVRVCGWCQNVALPDGRWVPVEAAVKRMGLMAEEEFPRLTHGICPPCHSGVLAQLPPEAGFHGRPECGE